MWFYFEKKKISGCKGCIILLLLFVIHTWLSAYNQLISYKATIGQIIKIYMDIFLLLFYSSILDSVKKGKKKKNHGLTITL